MRIVKTRAALLSDYEVLQLLRDTETRQREAARPDNEDAEAWMKAVPPNVRTIQFETIASLSQAHRPCARQEAHHIHGFLKAVEEKGYAPSDAKILQGTPGLTKAERLQLVNHAPMSVVELHTLVEELGQRMSDEQIDDILQCVMTHLPAPQAQVEPLEVEAQPVLDEAPDTYAADEMAVDEDAFPEEHFEHEGPSTAVAADDDDD
ncbi:hypothetical protein GLX27_001284 [Malassezia furfur]|uniref:DNA-directed RNA polymerase III subunit RPC9 n=1 Tax=Malassezia furfur TaxID=55194 RepID=A0ABY8EM62_MALFU|nr:hypothetical protein GLX27_001284 [Malassezia furfur]